MAIAPEIAVPYVGDSRRNIINGQRSSDRGIYMRYIMGQVIHRQRRFTNQHMFDLGCITVIDSLIGNPDRHGFNAMVTKQHVYPIDHGGCFWTPLQVTMFSELTTNSEDEHFLAGVSFALDRVSQYTSEIADFMHSFPSVRGPDVKRWVARQKKKVAKEGVER